MGGSLVYTREGILERIVNELHRVGSLGGYGSEEYIIAAESILQQGYESIPVRISKLWYQNSFWSKAFELDKDEARTVRNMLMRPETLSERERIGCPIPLLPIRDYYTSLIEAFFEGAPGKTKEEFLFNINSFDNGLIYLLLDRYPKNPERADVVKKLFRQVSTPESAANYAAMVDLMPSSINRAPLMLYAKMLENFRNRKEGRTSEEIDEQRKIFISVIYDAMRIYNERTQDLLIELLARLSLIKKVPTIAVEQFNDFLKFYVLDKMPEEYLSVLISIDDLFGEANAVNGGSADMSFTLIHYISSWYKNRHNEDERGNVVDIYSDMIPPEILQNLLILGRKSFQGANDLKRSARIFRLGVNCLDEYWDAETNAFVVGKLSDPPYRNETIEDYMRSVQVLKGMIRIKDVSETLAVLFSRIENPATSRAVLALLEGYKGSHLRQADIIYRLEEKSRKSADMDFSIYSEAIALSNRHEKIGYKLLGWIRPRPSI